MAENYQLTQKAKKILGNARRIAMHQYSEIIGTHHLLGGIINEEGCVAYRVLRDLGIDEDVIFNVIEQEKYPEREFQQRLGEDIKKTLEYAVEEAE
ncbi:MAG: hypothetical protein GYA81_08360, partial [Chloroflexi bacterium]|nr:hypothetical protein [Chloroflexota bacterium]